MRNAIVLIVCMSVIFGVSAFFGYKSLLLVERAAKEYSKYIVEQGGN